MMEKKYQHMMEQVNMDEGFASGLLEQIQAYIDGEYLYIPRRETSRKPWGAANGRKAETLARNQEIYRRYREGTSVDQLAEAYFLAPKSIWKIIARLRNE